MKYIIVLIIILIFSLLCFYYYFNQATVDEYEQDYIKYKDVLDFNIMYSKEEPYIQYQKSIGYKYTNKGYKLTSMDPNIKKELLQFWNNYQNHKSPENKSDIEGVIYNTIDKNKNTTYLLELNQYNINLFNKVNDYVKQILLNWTGLNDIEHTSTYGLREYKHGSVLNTHVDRGNTHIISVIINIYGDKPWPLIVYDHNNNMESINMTEKDDLVLYESATIFHGRPIPFRGDSFVNLFIHFKTNEWIEVENKIREKYDITEF